MSSQESYLDALKRVIEEVVTPGAASVDADGAFPRAQLDALGTLVGQSRQVPFQPSGGVSPILDDNTYRILLQAKIAQNQFDGQIDSAERKADEFLGIGDRKRDGQNRVTGREHPGGRQDRPGDRKPQPTLCQRRLQL